MRERKCLGRPRSKRCLSGGDFRCMMPACRGGETVESVALLPEEIEAIKLADLMDLEQEEVAERMGVSRKTAWKDLHNARKKIADAIVNGKALRVDDCESADTEQCGFGFCKDRCGNRKCRQGPPVDRSGENPEQ
jgi:uncharacterized protein